MGDAAESGNNGDAGASMVNEPTSITTEPTEFALEGHRPCQNCGYDLVGTLIERARDLDLAVIRCPECGNLNPLVGTRPSDRLPSERPRPARWFGCFAWHFRHFPLERCFFSVEAMGDSMYQVIRK